MRMTGVVFTAVASRPLPKGTFGPLPLMDYPKNQPIFGGPVMPGVAQAMKTMSVIHPK